MAIRAHIRTGHLNAFSSVCSSDQGSRLVIHRRRLFSVDSTALVRSIALALAVLVGGVFGQVRAATGITLVQDANKDAGATTSSSLAFASNNAAGN